MNRRCGHGGAVSAFGRMQAGNVQSAVSGENGQRFIAAICAALMLWLMARLLLLEPQPSPASHASVTTQVYFVRRESPRLPQQSPPPALQPPPSTTTAARSSIPPPVIAQRNDALRRNDEPPSSDTISLYTRDGRVRVRDEIAAVSTARPPGATAPDDAAKKLLERDNPIDYRPTRFDKDWASDGTLGQIAARSFERGLKKATKTVTGMLPLQQIKPPTARAPPDVAFNPAQHANPADLGSEATGDAYKAAPIAHEKPPGDGEASRRIRESLAALRQRSAGCERVLRDKLLAPADRHLKDLEQAEHGLAHGADPLLAERILPQQLDSAYDLSRRALWYAQKKLATCGG
ncbi:MAG: hypothetical protein QM599_09165 [Pseudoxanthomonas sp.]